MKPKDVDRHICVIKCIWKEARRGELDCSNTPVWRAATSEEVLIKPVKKTKRCVPKRILPLLHFNAARLLCSALMSTWVVLDQITHCPFFTYRKWWRVFKCHFFFVFFHFFFVLANCKQTAKTTETQHNFNARIKCITVIMLDSLLIQMLAGTLMLLRHSRYVTNMALVKRVKCPSFHYFSTLHSFMHLK